MENNMPCYDPRGTTKTVTIYESGVSPSELARMVDTAQRYQAMLCALINELEARGIAANVVAEASRKGLVDIISFWEEHSKSDEARLANELHKYSKDEQEILRKILVKSNL